MVNRIVTYRNSVNGEIGVYPEELAKHFPNLVEVDDDAKPLAYVPIPREAIDALLGKPIFAAVADAEDFTPEDQPDSGEEGDHA